MEPHYNLGLALRDNGDRGRAIRELRTALRIKPDSLPAQSALGTTLQESGQLQAAEEAFKKALQMDPSSRYALNGLSSVLIEEKRYSAAISLLANALHAPGLLNNLAIAYSKNGNLDEAVAVLQKVIQLEPASALAHANLASAYAQRKSLPRDRRRVPRIAEAGSLQRRTPPVAGQGISYHRPVHRGRSLRSGLRETEPQRRRRAHAFGRCGSRHGPVCRSRAAPPARSGPAAGGLRNLRYGNLGLCAGSSGAGRRKPWCNSKKRSN